MADNKKIASLIKHRWNTISSDMQDVFDRNATYTDMYKSLLNFDEAYPWDYRLVDPAIFQLIRTMMSRLNPDNARVNLLARNSNASQFRQKNQHVINWELSEMNKTLVFYRCILRALLGGRSYLSTGWLFEPAVKIKSDITGKDEFVFKDIMNRAVAKNIRFDDMVVANRNLPDIQDQPFVIERMAVRYGEMLDDNREKEFWYPKMLEDIKKKKMFLTQIENGFDLPQESLHGISEEEQFYRNQYVGLLKMSTKDNDVFYTFDQKGYDDILNKNTTNPYWHGHYPYLSFTPFPMDDEFFSQSMVQPLEDLEIALSSALNQYLTNARKSGNPMWIAGQSASQTPDWQFVNRPDGIIRLAGDANQIRQAPINDTSQLMNGLRGELSTLFEKSSSISSLYSSGVTTSSTSQVNKTATGAKVIDSNIDMNMQMLISLFGAQILTGIGDHFLELNSQYITEEQEVRITGKEGEFIKVKPSEITANFNVVANPDTITKTSPVVRQASLLNLKTTMDAEKKVQLDSKPIWKAIFASYPEIEEIDEDIIIDPEVQAQDAITAIKKGIKPTTDWNQNHKAIKKIIQFYVLSNEETIDDKELVLFTEYVDELTKWIDSDKALMTMEQEEMIEDQLNNPLGGGLDSNGQPLPTTETNIENSVNQSNDPIKNMPNNIAGQEMGLL